MRSTKRIVTLARTKDAHVEFVRKFLSEELFLIDIGRMVKYGLSYRFDGGPQPFVTLDGKQVEITPGTVKSVWLRNVDYEHMGPKLPLAPQYAYLRESSMASLSRMGHALPEFFGPDVLWVSKRSAIQKAELKPHQLAQASRAGFNIPKTLYTTAPQEALQFVRELKQCILKPLAPYPPEDKGQPARILRYANDLNLEGVRVQAHIFQQLIEPARELRVAVIGHEAFAAEVWDENAGAALAEGIRDYRRGVETDSLKTGPATLPKEVADSCVRYVRLMGLTCGFFDLIQDKKGVYWFLECNPNGQWAFVEEQTAEKIGKALARLLESAKLD